jgi:hypothetical protein
VSRGHTPKGPKKSSPLGVEKWFFLLGLIFFVPVFLLYGLWSSWEPIGSMALGLIIGMWGMVGVYLWRVGSRIDERPEDDPYADITADSDYGVFSPWSWWPLVLGLAAALVFLGVAVGWWLAGIGVGLGVIGLVGQVLEFNRGQHAH